MADFQFSYTIMVLLFLLVWIVLFVWRRDNRFEMLIMSLLIALPSPFMQMHVYVKDWWQPAYGLHPIFENFVYGFTVTGIAAVLYEDIFKKQMRIRRNTSVNTLALKGILTIAAIGFGVFALCFFVLQWNSFMSSIVPLLILLPYMYSLRPDLIVDSLASGVLLLGLVIVIYSIVEIFTPGWIRAYWLFRNVPDIVILNVPIDDIIWYLLSGMLFGPLYEFLLEARLSRKSSHGSGRVPT